MFEYFCTLISNTDPLSSPYNVSKDEFVIKAAWYTIIIKAYFVHVELLLVTFCDLKR